jgi:pyochelin biosynthesis protein PchC
MTAWDLNTGPWITRYTPATPDPGPVQLVCLPHAGGSATFFKPLAAHLPPGVDVLAVQYPGRQERRNEPCIEDIGQLADAVADTLGHLPESAPLAFFGHSMGALVGWEVARRMEARGRTRPVALIASGRGAPMLHRTAHLSRRTDDELVADLTALSGTQAPLLADPGILAMVLPVLRGDYRALDAFTYRPGTPLRCPVTVFLGDDDPWARREDAEGWRKETTGEVSFRRFPGGHFYLADQWPAVAAALAACLGRVPAA